jgi:3-oxoacyl-[acyl-carrier protein] reductase
MRRTAVVTGGAGGIGGAIVRVLTESDHDVAILDRQGEFAVDLADEQAVRAIAGRLGPRDVLVHAAAAFDRAGLADIDSATWRHVQAVNVESALWLCQALTPAMIERGFGRIIFITSNTVWRPPGRRLPALRGQQGDAGGRRPHIGQAARGEWDHGQLRGAGVDPHALHRGGPTG